ncbi:trimeric intracellular cation channel family protein [Salinimonas sediminis]|uniref:Trimeric intracellular cation channel family protein n=1 Tax=Salinimonas sediminis TaxID=2303538 RepID=A0A346NHE3_9ALTE|nr:trimeric intracellular cation channel family protein [Salinimonas sediminis]AXR04950.1 trimeric intracellular cation channel family protein [Salinimonas sediminis]
MSDEWFHVLNLIGVAFFSVSGTLMAFEKDVDGFGVVVLASITAVGGGTLRDVLLDQPVFWIAQADYLYITYAASIVTIILQRTSWEFPSYTLNVVDAFGLGLFNIIGIEKSLINETGMVIAITLGTTTGIFGGLIRDVICREIPMVMRGDLYATACLSGGLMYAGLFYLSVPYIFCILGSLATTIFLRMGALHWNWEVPIFKRPGG